MSVSHSTWAGLAIPMHFHDKKVMVVFPEDGDLQLTLRMEEKKLSKKTPPHP